MSLIGLAAVPVLVAIANFEVVVEEAAAVWVHGGGSIIVTDGGVFESS